jgi:chemotaxis signal transduction protein
MSDPGPDQSAGSPQPERGSTPSSLDVVLFELRGRRCAAALSAVQEVLPLGPIARVGTAPPAVAGAVNVRGHVVAVLDLGLMMDGVPAKPREGEVCLLVHLVGYEVAIHVGRVLEVATLDLSGARAPTAGAPEAGIITEIPSSIGPLFLIDLERALQRVSRDIVSAWSLSGETDHGAGGAPVRLPEGES